VGLTIRVKGAEELRALARQCRDIGRRDLVRKLYRGFQRAVRPFEQEVRSELPEHTPGAYTGTLNESLRVRASVKTVGKGVGVSIVGTALGRSRERDLPAVDAGLLRHKLFGHPPWYSQAVMPGFFTGPPADRLIQRVEEEVQNVLDEVADELERG
jgi:hypothetical protein